jgi:hypothetical protein
MTAHICPATSAPDPMDAVLYITWPLRNRHKEGRLVIMTTADVIDIALRIRSWWAVTIVKPLFWRKPA